MRFSCHLFLSHLRVHSGVLLNLAPARNCNTPFPKAKASYQHNNRWITSLRASLMGSLLKVDPELSRHVCFLLAGGSDLFLSRTLSLTFGKLGFYPSWQVTLHLALPKQGIKQTASLVKASTHCGATTAIAEKSLEAPGLCACTRHDQDSPELSLWHKPDITLSILQQPRPC